MIENLIQADKAQSFNNLGSDKSTISLKLDKN